MIQKFLELREKRKEIEEEESELIEQAVSNGKMLLIEKNDSDGWTRIKIIDNKERIDDGYFEFAKVKRYTVKIDILKNRPKEIS